MASRFVYYYQSGLQVDKAKSAINHDALASWTRGIATLETRHGTFSINEVPLIDHIGAYEITIRPKNGGSMFVLGSSRAEVFLQKAELPGGEKGVRGCITFPPNTEFIRYSPRSVIKRTRNKLYDTWFKAFSQVLMGVVDNLDITERDKSIVTDAIRSFDIWV